MRTVSSKRTLLASKEWTAVLSQASKSTRIRLETSCTYNWANESFVKSSGLASSNNVSPNTTPPRPRNNYKGKGMQSESLLSFSNLATEDNTKSKGDKKIKVISKEKLSNRAKTILKLENIIKQLRDPSLTLSKTRTEGDSKYCSSFRSSIKTLAEQLKTSINRRDLSVESLSSVLDSLRYLDQNYQ